MYILFLYNIIVYINIILSSNIYLLIVKLNYLIYSQILRSYNVTEININTIIFIYSYLCKQDMNKKAKKLKSD